MAESTSLTIQPNDHLSYMRVALETAKQAPHRGATNYRVGAVLVDAVANEILATGHTLELPGNTHAEQCCLAKLARRLGLPEGTEESELGSVLRGRQQSREEPRTDDGESAATTATTRDTAGKLVMYTTMEPCSFRLSGNLPCADRIARLGGAIGTVYVGVAEPNILVSHNTGRKTLEDAGIRFVHVQGLEKEILEVAMAGHHTDSAAQ